MQRVGLSWFPAAENGQSESPGEGGGGSVSADPGSGLGRGEAVRSVLRKGVAGRKDQGAAPFSRRKGRTKLFAQAEPGPGLREERKRGSHQRG